MKLIDADALKEKLRGNAQKDGSPFVGVIVKTFCDFLDQAPDAEERGEIGGAPRWIPVTESLPGHHKRVLVYVAQFTCRRVTYINTTVMAYLTDIGFICCEYEELICGVTHWMPLPEPPEVK